MDGVEERVRRAGWRRSAVLAALMLNARANDRPATPCWEPRPGQPNVSLLRRCRPRGIRVERGQPESSPHAGNRFGGRLRKAGQQ